MTEDFSPYMIPKPLDLHISLSRAVKEPDRNKLYKKSSTTNSARPALNELQNLLTTSATAYIANFKVDSRVPYYVHHSFDRDMELFSRQLSVQVANTYDNAIGTGTPASKAIVAVQDDIKSGLRTLSSKLNRYDNEFSAWLALENLQKNGYTRYLFISEQSATTCDRCQAYHGKVFSIEDVPIPPLHLNCRCELLAMDTRTEALYHINERAFIEAFRQAINGQKGGIYQVNYDTFPFSITPANLTRINLPRGHVITDLSHPKTPDSDSDFDLAAAAASYFSELAADGKDLISYLLNAQAQRSDHKWDSFGSFMDWLTLGIVSGIWRGMVYRHEAMVEDPSLYNIANALTMGLLDTIKGAVVPEDPWSLEHWLDIIGTILSVYAAYKIASNVKNVLTGSGDDAARAAGTMADDVDDIVRNAGLTQSQIDDIINTPRGLRPDPDTYLTKEYIEQHLDMFQGGATKFYAKEPTGTVGPPEGTFVMPSTVADDLIRQADGDVRILEELLGLDPGDLGDHPVRIDISDPQGLRMPTGNERGANDYWLPGGYTSGGIPEAVVDQLQAGQYIAHPLQ